MTDHPAGPRRVSFRPVTLAAAAVVIAAAAITGTYAYTNFGQHAVNEFSGGAPPGLRLHDDYAMELDAVDSNKDVYVENYGSVPQFVRLRLTEYMDLDGTSLVAGAERGNPDTWTIHVPQDAGDNGPDGAVDDVAGQPFQEYWTWVLGGEKYYLPTTNHAQLGDADTSDDYLAGLPDVNTNTYQAGDPGVKQTAPTLAVVTMQWWFDNHAPEGAYWIWDTDGWAYWSVPLPPGEATSLLLDEVKRAAEPPVAAEYYYAVDVQLEAVTANEIREGKWFADSPRTPEHPQDPTLGLTEDAQTLLTVISGSAPPVTAVVVNCPPTLGVGQSATLTAHAQPLYQIAQDLSWSGPEGFGTVTLTPADDGQSATLTLGSDVRPGDIFTVKVAAVGSSVTGECQVMAT